MSPYAMWLVISLLVSSFLRKFFSVFSNDHFDTQKYMLARPVVITKPLVFATAFMCVLSFANGLLKVINKLNAHSKKKKVSLVYFPN